MKKYQRTFIILLIILTSCSSPNNYIVTRWPDGSKQVEYIIEKGDQTHPVDFKYIAYYRNGDIFKTGQFKNGKEDGIWNFYYLNGILKSSGYFSNGKKNGDFSVYYRTGKMEQKGVYKNDTIIEHSIYDRNGKFVSKYDSPETLIKEKSKPWNDKQLYEMKLECEMPFISDYENAVNYCSCILDTISLYTDYEEYYNQTERELRNTYTIIQSMNYCDGILIERNNAR